MDLRAQADALSRLIARQKQSNGDTLNEAATRLEFVDEILEKVLGWPKHSFHPEDYAGGIAAVTGSKKKDWLDYHLKSGETFRLVVEAKRVGATFNLPTTKQPRSLRLAQLRHNHGDQLNATLKQAIRYCLKVGTYGFVVTNGVQWIASVAFAHNVPADKHEAVVFYSLEDIAANLGEFVELLSPDGLANQILMARAVRGEALIPAYARRLRDVLRAPPTEGRNYLAQPMRALMNICFADLTDSDHAEMLDSCYVSSEVTDDYIRRLEAFGGHTLPDDISRSDNVKRGTAEAEAFGARLAAEGAPVLLVGRAGSGKSTFLAITKRRLEKRAKNSDSVFLYLDLVTRTQTHAERFDHERLVDELCTELLIQAEGSHPQLNPFESSLLSQIFAGEIKRLRSSLMPGTRDSADADQRVNDLIRGHLDRSAGHLKAYLGYLQREGVPVVIFLDNVDRGTPEFERVTFKLAQTLSQNTGATTVTCLRDTTYQSGKSGFLDVGRHTVFTITPPSFTEVARRRFTYAATKLNSDERLSKRFERSLGGFSRERVLDFAAILAQVILGPNLEAQDLIQALAGTNVRRALELLEDLATSPSTDPNRLFSYYRQLERQGDSGPPLDLVLRALMQPNAARYSEKDSKIINLFQSSTSVVASHFSAIRILQLLEWRAAQARDAHDLTVSEVLAHLGAIGHLPVHTREVLEHLGKHRLVNSLSRPEPNWSDKDTVRLGAAGRYYLNVILYNREYLRNIVDDTILYDESTFTALHFVHNDRSRDWPTKSVEKSRLFLTYLANAERNEMRQLGTLRPRWVSPVAEGIGLRHFGRDFSLGLRSKRSTSPPPR